MVAEGGEEEWFALSSKCSTKKLFGILDDEEDNKHPIEIEGAEVVEIGNSNCSSRRLSILL